jgi:hypothetical protein
MTVAELIAALGQLPSDSRVVAPHLERGFDNVVRVHALPIKLGRRSLEAAHMKGQTCFRRHH